MVAGDLQRLRQLLGHMRQLHQLPGRSGELMPLMTGHYELSVFTEDCQLGLRLLYHAGLRSEICSHHCER